MMESAYDTLTVEQAQRLAELGFSFICEDGHVTGCNFNEEVKAG